MSVEFAHLSLNTVDVKVKHVALGSVVYRQMWCSMFFLSYLPCAANGLQHSAERSGHIGTIDQDVQLCLFKESEGSPLSETLLRLRQWKLDPSDRQALGNLRTA